MDYSNDIKIIAVDIRTPENLASIYRLADAAGCKTVILVGNQSTYNTKQFSRISRSSEKFLTIEKYSYEEFFEKNNQFHPLIAIEITTESKNLFEVDLPDKCCFVIGNEKQGIDDKILGVCDCAINIPMFGSNGSMNVSHALAISLFEWRRQRS